MAGTAGTGGSSPGFQAVATIMSNNCGLSACHGGGLDGQDLVFTNLSTLHGILMTKVVKECNSSVLVVPNNPAASALLMLPTWKCNDFVMPNGCIEDPCLRQDELDAITNWIASGAPP
jgi:hypothetical protein